MIQVVPFGELVRRAFEPTPRGAAGLAEELLELGRDRGLRAEFVAGRCHVRASAGGPRESADVPVPKPVFRAALARVAALCRDRNPASATPYRGGGEVAVPGHPAAVVRVAFANTPGEQWLEVGLAGDATAYREDAQ